MNARQPATGPPDTRNLDLIREDIVRTRQELGATVEALTARMDVKSRAQERIREVRARALGTTAKPMPVAVAVLAFGAVVALVVLRRRQLAPQPRRTVSRGRRRTMPPGRWMGARRRMLRRRARAALVRRLASGRRRWR